MKFLTTVAIALLLLVLESVAVKRLGLSVSRIDVTVVLVVFLAVRAERLEGGFASFAIGYLLDLMSGRPTGLYVFLAMLVFLLGRLASMLVEARSAGTFLLFVAGADLGHSLLALFFTWTPISPWGIAGQLLLSTLAALMLWPLLRRIDPGTDRPQAGALL